MSFIRAFVGRTSNQVQHVIESDTPFEGDGAKNVVRAVNARGEPIGEELYALDLGWMEPCEYKTSNGSPASPARHVFDRVKGRPAPSKVDIAARADLPRFHDSPCSMDGIKDLLRAQGPTAIPVKVRAWLATVLPPDEVSAMGIARGLPISVLKATEALRNKRDPSGGSRMFVLERKAQQQADAQARARLEARHSKAKASPPKGRP